MAVAGGAAPEGMSPVHPRRRLPRRHFLTALAGTAAAFVLAPARVVAGTTAGLPAAAPRPAASVVNNPALDGKLTHFAWVWSFDSDGNPEDVREALAAHDLGVVVKTHDGTDWMSEFDTSPDAVSGPDQVAKLAAFFEAGGVPFHAWYNTHGHDPAAEAEMAAGVLGAGARSLFIDLEAHGGFWEGTPDGALLIGELLRACHPDAWLSLSIDPRPWEIGRIPLAEFSSFANEIAPQVYWGQFRDPANLARFRDEGHDPGSVEGITPRFILDAAMPQLREFGLPIHPIGDGTAGSNDGWPGFLDESFALLSDSVSVWRFGEAESGVLRLLRDTPPRRPSYVVRPGDALSVLADDWGIDLGELMAANGITDANRIWIGQRLVVPLASGRAAHVASWRTGGGAHTIAPGDTLSELAERWSTSVEEIARLNGITDPGHVWIGQQIVIPPAGGSPTAATPAPMLPASYTIGPGDTLSELAERWDTSVEEIARLNGITNPAHVAVGLEIAVPRSGNGPAAALPATSPPVSYTIAPGDNLWSLARRWDTSVEEILRVNRIADADAIRIGETLIVP